MEDLRQEFLSEAIANLKSLKDRLETEPFSGELEREIFRRLHTLKGTSQTFNLNVSAKLAHEIENLPQAARDDRALVNKDFTALLSEGITLLIETFQNSVKKQAAVFPDDFVRKIHDLLPHSFPSTVAENLSEFIPPEFLKQLASQEKETLTAAISRGRFIYSFEVGFDFTDFDEQFKNLRQILLENGEIIASFPSPKFAAENKIGFQIFHASLKDTDKISEIIEPFGANLINQNYDRKFAGDLNGVLAQAVSAGEKTARKLSKNIEFSISANEIGVSGKQLKLISDILLHLIRNAVDHAFEKEGAIKIEVLNQENALLLRVTDDGRGIDAEKIRAKAEAKNLISGGENLSKVDLFKLIFTPGFSTSEQVSEISGRGVGLDVVETAVKSAGGEIRVESETANGTTFEICLPKEY